MRLCLALTQLAVLVQWASARLSVPGRTLALADFNFDRESDLLQLTDKSTLSVSYPFCFTTRQLVNCFLWLLILCLCFLIVLWKMERSSRVENVFFAFYSE